MFLTRYLSVSFFSILLTKLRSILITSSGRSLMMPMEENPVPKSSRAIRMPLDFRPTITFLSIFISSSLHRSVTSRHRRSGGKSSTCRICSTRSTKSGFSSCE